MFFHEVGSVVIVIASQVQVEGAYRWNDAQT
jgi:hypothetical protein